MPVITGTSGADTLTSTTSIADTILAGGGNDSIVWRNGGSDVIDGGDGFDTFALTETATGRAVFFTGVGGQTFVSDVAPAGGGGGGPVVMQTGAPAPPAPTANLNLSHVEQINASVAVGDSISVSHLLDGDLTRLNLAISRLLPSGGGAFVAIGGGDVGERITVVGSSASELFVQETVGAQSVITDVSRLISSDTISISGGSGDDVISPANGLPNVRLSFSGGAGADSIDLTSGVTAHGDAGDDTFQWHQVFGTQASIDGGVGRDTLFFNTDFSAPDIQLSSVSGQLLVKDIATGVSLTAANVEQVTISNQQQANSIIVGDLTGAGVEHVTINANGANTIILTDTEGADAVSFASTVNDLIVSGLPEGVDVYGARAGDTIQLVAGGGNDFVQGGGIVGNSFHVDLIGGAGDDTIVGALGNSRLLGGDGFDVLSGSGGFSTTFDFSSGNTGFDHVTNFRVGGADHDVIELDGFGFRYTNDFSNFILHNTASDGHGGTEIITDSGFLIADIQGVTLNLFQASDFVFG